ncbi:MAG: hypothetical protein H6735_10740 [Alphaproteobacteria bacterium]|nr:hypothetical protein [Alphaproteobacteria bacterium]
MRFSLGFLAATVLVGCAQDYDINPPASAFGVANPVTLDNPEVRDDIVQVTPPIVDVLWIIDNSGSMQDNQTALATNFPSFMGYFLDSGLDYHIGVVSTDMDDPQMSGKLREVAGKRWIDNNSVDAPGTFSAMAQIGANGSPDEKGREAAYTGLELLKDGYNAGYLRDLDVGGFHAVVISDENDASTNNPVSKAEFIDYLKTLRIDPTLVSFSSIVQTGIGVNQGRDYIEITTAVGGEVHDIALGEWVNVLDHLGSLAAGLKREYFLSQLPVEASLDVTVTLSNNVTTLTFQQGSQYLYSPDRNSITFVEYVPDPLSTVHIKYTALSQMVDVEDIAN